MALEVISELPQTQSSETPLLFVHGAWHAAWCWRNFQPFFARNGYASHALSFRGHGASHTTRSLRSVSIGDYVNDVAEVAARLPSPPIVIAHSMGGFVMHHYLQQHDVAGVVFVAPIPPRGVWGATWNGARRHPVAFAKVNATMSLYPMVSTVARAKDLLFSPDIPDGEAAEYQALLQDESYKGYLQMFLSVRRKPKAQSPVLVLGAAGDTLATASDMRSTARHYGCEATMIDGIAHDMMLDVRWQKTADAILSWLGKQKFA